MVLLVARLVRDRHQAHEARPRPPGRHRARLPGHAHAAGARGHPAGGGRRDRHDPQAHRRARRVRARDPALGARPDLGRPARRAERRARHRAGGHHRPAPVLRLGAERARPRAGRALRGHEGALPGHRGGLEGEAQGGGQPTCRRARTSRPRRPTARTTRRATATTSSAPTSSRSARTRSRCATATTTPASCEELLSDYEPEDGPAPEYAPRPSASRSSRRSAPAGRPRARG